MKINSIPYGRQSIDQDDIDAVVRVLKGDWLTQGPSIEKFERKLAEYCGAEFAVTLSSGTAALHLACLALGVTESQHVITSPITFAASSNSVIYAGGVPVFCDIRSDSLVVDPDKIKACLNADRSVSGIIPVHMGGALPDLERIQLLAKDKGVWVLEDACHSIGGRWRDSQNMWHMVGDCSHSDATVFSFHPVKHITTGEGGAVLTNNRDLYEKICLLRTHGITRDPKLLRENHGGWYYEMQALGYNYRITDIQAALGISQLNRSDQWVARRQEIVTRYDQAFLDINKIQSQIHPSEQKLSYHLYIVKAERRKALYDYLKSKGIYTQVHYVPVHLHPYYQDTFGYRPGDFPESESYYKSALSLPLYPDLKNSEQEYVIQSVREFYLNE